MLACAIIVATIAFGTAAQAQHRASTRIRDSARQRDA